MPTYLPTLPYTPGGDVCGEVVEIGADVTEFSIGDKGCVLIQRAITYRPLVMAISVAKAIKTQTGFGQFRISENAQKYSLF